MATRGMFAGRSAGALVIAIAWPLSIHEESAGVSGDDASDADKKLPRRRRCEWSLTIVMLVCRFGSSSSLPIPANF